MRLGDGLGHRFLDSARTDLEHADATSTPNRLAATILRTFVDAAEGLRMTQAVKWAIMSTANINRKVIPGAHASP